MKCYTETKTLKRVVEVTVDEDVTEVTLVLSDDEAQKLKSLLGRTGPKQVEFAIKEKDIGRNSEFSVDEIMTVVYDLYNVLFDNTKY